MSLASRIMIYKSEVGIGMRLIVSITLLVIALLTVSTFAANNPLPAEQAFIFSVRFDRHHEVRAEWKITSGYYLYTKKTHFSFQPKVVADIKFPQGDYQYDKERGRYEAFSGHLSIPIVLKTNMQQVQMHVDYQGCSQDGFCYPPIRQSMILNMADQSITKINDSSATPPTSLTTLLMNQSEVSALLRYQQLSITLLMFVGLGLLLTLTPCVWPMVPILTTIIVGQREQLNTKKAFLLSLAYVLGAALIYALAGLAAASLGHSVQMWLQQPWIIATTSILFVLLALSLFGYYDLQLPRRWQHRIASWNRMQHGKSYSGAFFMGAISTLIISPCVTAPLVGVLMYIAETGDKVLGASALFAMGIGMGIPLLMIGVSAGKWLPKSGLWMEMIKNFFGILMLGMAIWLFSRITSQTVTILLSSFLLIGVLLYLISLYNKLWFRCLGLLASCSVLIVMLTGISTRDIGNEWLQSYFNHRAAPPPFVLVRNTAEFNKQLAFAKIARKPIILDFYADWCESCVTMDKHIFHRAAIKKSLADYVLLRVDLSNNTVQDEALLKYFNVIAPPTVLFFNKNGKELISQRIVGEVSAKEFLRRVANIE